MKVQVSKYHGCGNDFILLREHDAQNLKLDSFIPAVCDRHTGIGADGVILVRENPLTMVFYNCDGSKAPMCGNGIRCFARFCVEEKIVDQKVFDVKTLAGTKTVYVEKEDPFYARVAMGKADFSPKAIGVEEKEPVWEKSFSLEGTSAVVDSFFLSTVHTVWYVEDPEDPKTQQLAGKICKDPFYTEQTNVNMARILDRKTILMRTWERGVGMTLACGTGACAVAVDAVKRDLCENQVEVLLPKGRLTIRVEADGNVWMSGPAERIIKGVYEG